MISRLGQRVLDLKDSAGFLAALINQTVYWMIVGPFKAKGTRFKWVVKQVVLTGVGAVPIVSLISLCMGVILALQAAVQLRRVGALAYVATLVAVSVVRELGPLITAVVVAGRSGSAFAAEIASMTVSEEVDALKTMGIPPVKMLVAPKVIALVLAMPCLTLIADLVSIGGGFVIGVAGLGISFDSYYHQTLAFMTVGDIVGGLVKAVFFALIIAVVGCYQGLAVTGGAEGVGRRTTSSVVASIFLVIVADGFFTLLTYLTG